MDQRKVIASRMVGLSKISLINIIINSKNSSILVFILVFKVSTEFPGKYVLVGEIGVKVKCGFQITWCLFPNLPFPRSRLTFSYKMVFLSVLCGFQTLGKRMRHIRHTPRLTALSGVTQNGEGITSSSQLFFLLFCTDASCPLTVHKGPAAQSPYSVEHSISQGITGYFHIGDKAQTPFKVRADRVEAPSEFCITAILVGTTSVVTDVQLVAALGHCWNAQVHSFWYLETQEIGAAAIGLLRLVARSGHWCLSVSAPVLTDSIFPSQQFQKGIEVAVDRFKAVPDVPKAPV